MGAEMIILANPYTYNFLKGLTHIAVYGASQRLTQLPNFDGLKTLLKEIPWRWQNCPKYLGDLAYNTPGQDLRRSQGEQTGRDGSLLVTVSYLRIS